MPVPQISGKGVYRTFCATKSGPRIVKKKPKKKGGGYLTFHTEIFFFKGVVFLSLSLFGRLKNLNRGI